MLVCMLPEVLLGEGELLKVKDLLLVSPGSLYVCVILYKVAYYYLMLQVLFNLCPFLFEVLDTATGVWLDRNGVVTSSRLHKSSNDHDPSLELLRRCRHAAAPVGTQIYIYGGLKGGKINNPQSLKLLVQA